MDPTVEKLLESPHLALYAQQIEGVLLREKAAHKRFYSETVGDKALEFINGAVTIHPSSKAHHDIVSRLYKHLGFVQVCALGDVATSSLIQLTRNDYEPELCFFGAEKSASFTPTQLFPAPDFVVEVLSESTADKDRNIKASDYAAHSVEEYWIIDPDKVLEQYLLKKGEETYDLELKSGTGTVKISAVEGFELPIKTLFDDAENMRTLKAMLTGV